MHDEFKLLRLRNQVGSDARGERTGASVKDHKHRPRASPRADRIFIGRVLALALSSGIAIYIFDHRGHEGKDRLSLVPAPANSRGRT